tara:strand:- start:623 stop:805 length:183 start_codon:yes stop_codon:yes gene_type:complete
MNTLIGKSRRARQLELQNKIHEKMAEVWGVWSLHHALTRAPGLNPDASFTKNGGFLRFGV